MGRGTKISTILLLAVLVAGCAQVGAPTPVAHLATEAPPTVEPDTTDTPARVSTVGLPPAGIIWFGTTFDPDTLVLAKRITSVGATAPFSFVGHLTREMDGAKLVIRSYWNSKLVGTSSANGEGTSELWGFSPGPLFEKGKWKYELTDIGGNVLASGTITAT